jgi:hypothetical protein
MAVKSLMSDVGGLCGVQGGGAGGSCEIEMEMLPNTDKCRHCVMIVLVFIGSTDCLGMRG